MKENQATIPQVFLSNRLENLADRMLEQLFSSRSAPFEPRVIVVPDLEMKTYLLHRFARDPERNIAAGMQMITLSEAVQQRLRKQKKEQPFYLPSAMELSIKLEDEIFFLMDARKDLLSEEKQIFQELWDYLGVEEKNPKQIRLQVISLCEELSSVFLLYGIYEKTFLEEWLQNKGWKQELWKRIFYEGSSWTYPQKKLKESPSTDEKVHIFGFSFLPQVYFSFFNQQSAFYYFLSPCEQFWEDIYSDKERVFFQKILEGKKIKLAVREQFNFYLKESNPLLANWGKLGREFIKMMGEKEVFIEEDYIKDPSENPSLLQKVQEDLLQLYTKEDRQDIVFSEDDGSLKLLSATSKLREVEILLEELYGLIEKNNETDDPICPGDIVVLCPRLVDYLPYIHMVFGAPDCLLDYSIRDVESRRQDDFLQAFDQLILLTQNRFDLASVQKLFSFSSFQQKWGWKREDVSLLSKWFEKGNVRWGYDAEQKKEFLSSGEDVSSTGTWQHAFDQLLLGLAFTVAEEEVPDTFSWGWPLNLVEWSDSELLGQVIHILRSLAEEMKELHQEKEKTFSEWIENLQRLAQNYLTYEEEHPLFYELKRLKKVFEGQLLKGRFSFQSFLRIFEQVRSKKKETFQGSHLQAVKFSPLAAGKVLPSKVLYILGIEEESFPRKQPLLSLNEMQSFAKKEFSPSKIEEDRYLFLEALLSARKHFVLSYQRVSSEDQKPQNPSPVVQEFFSYLDQIYQSEKGHRPSEKLIFSHPALSFHRSYFEEDSRIKSYSSHHALAAKSYYSSQKQDLAPFFSELSSADVSHRIHDEKTVLVSIKQLAKFAKHPIRFFFQEILGIYFDSLFQEKEEEFIFPAYEKSLLRESALKKPFEGLMKMAEAKGKLPTGLFKELAYKKTRHEVVSIKGKLLQWGLKEKDVFSAHLDSNCKEPLSKEGKKILPALKIKGGHGITYLIEGTLPNLSSDGLIHYGEDTLKDLIQIWPLYLIFHCLPSLEGMEKRDLLLTKEGASKTFSFKDPQGLLAKYLDYFEESKEAISPLLPIWADVLLLKAPADFEKKMQEKSFLSTTPFPDDYLRWLFLRDATPNAKIIYEKGEKLWKEIFGPLLKQEIGGEA